MKIFIDGKVYSPNDTPIIIYLTDHDKDNIINMDCESKCYGQFPDGTNIDDAKEIMTSASEKFKED